MLAGFFRGGQNNNDGVADFVSTPLKRQRNKISCNVAAVFVCTLLLLLLLLVLLLLLLYLSLYWFSFLLSFLFLLFVIVFLPRLQRGREVEDAGITDGGSPMDADGLR